MGLFGKSRTEELEQQQSELYEQVYQAWESWQNAQRYFEFASDPELIDYSIYLMEATRRFYVYMLKKVQEGEGRPGLEPGFSLKMLPTGTDEPPRLASASKR